MTHVVCQYWRHLEQSIFQLLILWLQGHFSGSNNDLQRDEPEGESRTSMHVILEFPDLLDLLDLLALWGLLNVVGLWTGDRLLRGLFNCAPLLRRGEGDWGRIAPGLFILPLMLTKVSRNQHRKEKKNSTTYRRRSDFWVGLPLSKLGRRGRGLSVCSVQSCRLF